MRNLLRLSCISSSLKLHCGFDAVLCVGGDEDVTANVDPCAGAFLERDNRKAVEEVVKNLLAFFAGLGRDAVANLSGGIKDVVIADLCETS